METLGERLGKAIKEKGMTQSEICRKLNIPKSALSQYVSGKSNNMPMERLHALAKLLGKSEAWLMGYDVKDISIDEDRLLAIYRLIDEESKKNLIAYALFLEGSK